jgi:hypothetical protein
MERMRPPARPPKPEKPKREGPSPAELKRRRMRGKSGEREVVQQHKLNGWPDAFRTPGSGAWRPYGAGDSSPFPLDVAAGWPTGWSSDRRSPMAGPVMVEVKFDERMMQASRKGIVGEAFVRATCRKTEQQWRQYRSSPGSRMVWPVVFARANRSPWRIFVLEQMLGRYVGIAGATALSVDWVEVSDDLYWNLLKWAAELV